MRGSAPTMEELVHLRNSKLHSLVGAQGLYRPAHSVHLGTFRRMVVTTQTTLTPR